VLGILGSPKGGYGSPQNKFRGTLFILPDHGQTRSSQEVPERKIYPSSGVRGNHDSR